PPLDGHPAMAQALIERARESEETWNAGPHNGKTTGIREIAPEVRHFVFQVEDAESFSYVPGQFVSFTAEIKGSPITRAYSIASPPNGRRFDLCLNRVLEGHLSPYLFDLKPGDLVRMTGPFGGFIFRQPVQDSVLVATGTGVAPFRAMLIDQLQRDSSR